MIATAPVRQARPRTRGLTMVIDSGMPTGAFTDVIDSHGGLVDLVKFGWGTCLVTRDLSRKLDVLRAAGIDFYFGGTLFEHHLWSGRLGEFVDLLRTHRVTHVEVSNGTIPLDQHEKAGYVRLLAREFTVISEVGFKDAGRSEALAPTDWVAAMQEDLDAGASLVTAETRESGRCGMARADGSLRADVLGAVLTAVDPALVLFEAPTRSLQVDLIRAAGPDVNLGNIATGDIVGLETLRLGLRADTLMDLTPAAPARPLPAAAPLGRGRLTVAA
ncbi:MAG: phosphosulfolactate synthase [Chloroflexota bacterium]|jgi:phosphosulfolactate synthase|nr:phosphosulfolactate synthase [Chloroflexota bacterium]